MIISCNPTCVKSETKSKITQYLIHNKVISKELQSQNLVRVDDLTKESHSSQLFAG